ncbi:hypothetical protein PAMA_017776 [Pampus argenteus]
MEEQRVQTCAIYRTDPNLPQRFNNPNCFHGYSQKICNPLYRTSNQVYGSRRPTVHEMPTSFKGTTCQFSELMLHSGMYQDHGFNTSVERSQVTAAMATLNKRVKLRKAN